MPSSPSGKIGIRRPSHSHPTGGTTLVQVGAGRAGRKHKQTAVSGTGRPQLSLHNLYSAHAGDDEILELARRLICHYGLTSARHVGLAVSLAEGLLEQFRLEGAFEVVSNWVVGELEDVLDESEEAILYRADNCREAQETLSELYVGLCDAPTGSGQWRIQGDLLERLSIFLRGIREEIDNIDLFAGCPRSSIGDAIDGLNDAFTAVRSEGAEGTAEFVLLGRHEVGSLYEAADDLYLTLEKMGWILEQLYRQPGRVLRVSPEVERVYPIDDIRAACLAAGATALQQRDDVERIRRLLDPRERHQVAVTIAETSP